MVYTNLLLGGGGMGFVGGLERFMWLVETVGVVWWGRMVWFGV